MSRKKPKQATNTTQPNRYIHSEAQAQMVVSSIMSRLPQGVANQFKGKRDLNEALGYPEELDAATAYAKYRRNGMAGAVVDAPVTSTWQVPPEVREAVRKQPEGDAPYQPTKFEQAWESITERINVWDYMRRVDTLQRTGRYAVLVLGLSGAQALSEESTGLNSPDDLQYLTVYPETAAKVFETESNEENPRYGMPTVYEVDMVQPAKGGAKPSTRKIKMHWSRVIHVSERLLDSDVYGLIPIERSYNRFIDVERILGASGEGYWRGGMPGLHANATDPEADLDVDALIEEVDGLVHGFKKFVTTQGIDIKSLGNNLADPKGHFDIQVSAIAGAERIPQRLLIGNEAGQLASDQDETNWGGTIKDRRNNFVKPRMIYAFIDRLKELGVLPEPDTGYTAEWDESDNISAKDAAEIADKMAGALQKYDPMNQRSILAPEIFLSRFGRLDDDTLAENKKILEKQRAGELQDEEDDFADA